MNQLTKWMLAGGVLLVASVTSLSAFAVSDQRSFETESIYHHTKMSTHYSELDVVDSSDNTSNYWNKHSVRTCHGENNDSMPHFHSKNKYPQQHHGIGMRNWSADY